MPRGMRSLNFLSQAGPSETPEPSKRPRTLSQPAPGENSSRDDQKSVREMVNNCVRFFVFNADKRTIYKRSDFQKSMGCKAGSFLQQVIEKTTDVLEKVYGYKLILYDGGDLATKCYVLCNALPYMDYRISEEMSETDIERQNNKIVLFLILTHIFMSSNCATEVSLHSFLEQLGIDVNVRHPEFGLVKTYITHLIKEKYIVAETNPANHKVNYSWGLRAETEVSKHAILEFVGKMFDNRKPSSWTNHYRDAEAQQFSLTRNEEEMDTN